MSTSLYTWEILIKTVRYQSTSTRMTMGGKGEIASMIEAVEKLEHSHIADGNVKCCNVKNSLII